MSALIKLDFVRNNIYKRGISIDNIRKECQGRPQVVMGDIIGE